MNDSKSSDENLVAMMAETESAIVKRLQWVDAAIQRKLDNYSAGQVGHALQELPQEVPSLGRLYEVRGFMVGFFGSMVSFRARHGMLTRAEKDASVRALTS